MDPNKRKAAEITSILHNQGLRSRSRPGPPPPSETSPKEGFSIYTDSLNFITECLTTGLRWTEPTNSILMEYIYILKCADNTYYTGHTSNLENHIRRHNKGDNFYTKPGRPVILVTYLAFSDKYKAIDFERYLKSGSEKAFAQKRLI